MSRLSPVQHTPHKLAKAGPGCFRLGLLTFSTGQWPILSNLKITSARALSALFSTFPAPSVLYPCVFFLLRACSNGWRLFLITIRNAGGTNQLLHSHCVVEKELDKESEKEPQIIFDLPRPQRD